MLPRSPLPVFLKACRIVSTLMSPPKLVDTGLWEEPAVGSPGDNSGLEKDAAMLVGGEVLNACEEVGDRRGDGG